MTRRHLIAGGMALSFSTVISAMMPRYSLASGLSQSIPAMTSRRRVIVSTDVGGTDPDDFQSMVHLLVSADRIDIEGLISSPFGPGRKQDILDVIDIYAQDYPNLKTWSSNYPAPAALRQITKQGSVPSQGYAGFGQSTEGSELIVQCARKPDPRPLHVLVWGGIDDLAQALHDAPDILPGLRVYYIGGPNKKWSADAYQYIADHFPALNMIEANSTYRGWFTGGDQSDDLGNTGFVTQHVAPYGMLGQYFATKLGGKIKMGDTPSVAWVLNNDTSDPSSPGWGGQFVRAWARPHVVFDHLTTAADRVERFSVVEFRLTANPGNREMASYLKFENQRLPGYWNGEAMCFRCCPKKATLNHYSVESEIPELNGQTGSFTSFQPPAERSTEPSPRYPDWWTDNPDPQLAEGEHQGAKTVSRWRHEFLEDFAASMRRCAGPK
ncbi:hypothetical protein VA7868_03110 [Vibrio aerogenes CECT 7868]|uniref:Cellulose-binding Sde182 nucleoside hydrolase-like domain-containing protein n=1 Tax=Vibrio aerogenes CECT 7868 TaxID=1216006 RepID=A0A1M5ZRI9_9VIBR|nr:DUF1593 domain-containing protein [Vibrio aerogenes]SHI26834.1 hypothetical protein VA7868_03110 [Vibrio aerogenes CECT 7868]